MNWLKSSHLLVVPALASLLLCGCGGDKILEACRDDPLVDRSFITGQPCAPPCWYGLEIGKSTKWEVYDTVIALPFVEPGRVYWQELYRGEALVWHCPCYPRFDCGRATFIEDRLVSLSLDAYYELDFDTAVSFIGPPRSVYRRIEAPHGARVSLVWPEKKIQLSHMEIYLLALYGHIKDGNKMPRQVKARSVEYVVEEYLLCPRFREYCIDWPGFE